LSIGKQCELLELAHSTFYFQPLGADTYDIELMHYIDNEYTQHPFLGSRRMTAVLNRAGYTINRKRVVRLMQIMGISAIYPEPHLSIGGTGHKVFPYLLRGLKITRINQVWSIDITYLRLLGGFAYLVALIDWFSRYVLSFAVSTTLDHQFCLVALEDALMIANPDIFNSDQGSQFTCEPFIQRLQKEPIRISMDGKGRALDNVIIERLWRSVKYEDVYLKDYTNPRSAQSGLKEYFTYYNNLRPHQSLDYKTPAEVYHENN
jgi:putative transposase